MLLEPIVRHPLPAYEQTFGGMNGSEFPQTSAAISHSFDTVLSFYVSLLIRISSRNTHGHIRLVDISKLNLSRDLRNLDLSGRGWLLQDADIAIRIINKIRFMVTLSVILLYIY